MNRVWEVLCRRKKYDASASTENTQLARVLNAFDLTALGIGSTLGVGVYVIAGQVARETAGPAVIISFLIAAVASALSGLCYSEFGARVPKAGSAYIYSYVTVGEFIAFVIGWNLILEYVIGAASVAKGISVYIDSLTDNVLRNAFIDIAPINVNMMSEYFDFFAFGISVFLAVCLSFGLRESTTLNNIVTLLNLLIVIFIIIAGSLKANVENWRVPGNETEPSIGKGGFLPFGVSGMIKGAATCFYAFLGFDCLASTGEEVRNPKRAIPIAILVSLTVVFLAYFSTSLVLTLMIPYYEQDMNAAFPHAFEAVGMEEAKWIVAIGGMFGLFTSLFGSLLPLPRILYAMASDGMIFKFLGKINTTFSTPMIGTVIAGIVTGLMGGIFDLSQLVNMMSIGTLLAYTIVAVCVLFLRYRDAFAYDAPETSTNNRNLQIKSSREGCWSSIGGKIFGGPQEPTKTSQKVATYYILTYCALALIIAVLLFFLFDDLTAGNMYAIIFIAIIGGLMIFDLVLLSMQPTSNEIISFKVPLVPLIPACSILLNVYLMLMLDYQTWIRFGVWMLIGIPMYIICVRNSCHTPSRPSLKDSQFTHENNNNTNEHVNRAYVAEKADYIYEENNPSDDSGFERSSGDIDYSQSGEKQALPNVEEDLTSRRKNSLNSVDYALAELDKIISKEDGSNNKDAAGNFFVKRKLSIDTVSNASNCNPVKQDVVVLVHCEDVLSNPATPITDIPAPNLSDDSTKRLSGVIDDENTIMSKENLVQSAPPNSEDLNTYLFEINNKPIPVTPNETKDVQTPDQKFLSTEPITKINISVENENLDKEDTPRKSIHSPTSSITLDQGDDLGNETDADNMEDEDIIPSPPPPPPPPPPLADFETFKIVRIPRISLKEDKSRRISVKPETNAPTKPPDTPVIDYSRNDSQVSEDSEDESTDGKTDGYKGIRQRLTEIFSRNIGPQTKLTKPEEIPEDNIPKGSETLKPVMSKIISEITKNTDYDDEVQDNGREDEEAISGVDVTSQNPSDIRNRLNAIFKSNKPIPRPSNVPINPPVVGNVLENNTSPSTKPKNGDSNNNNNNNLESHRRQMFNTLSSIKLRKVDSFQNT